MINKKKTSRASETHKFGPDLDFATTEAFNLLRTNILFSFPDKKSGKVIGVTSPCPSDGKSFTSINIAYALAEAGNKVLLVDADMRRSSVAQSLGKPPAPGLSNLLVNNVQNFHHGVLHPNMSLITAGDVPPNPSELIGSESMKTVLEVCAQKYDYIVVDLPPVMSVSDALVISRYLDGMIVLVKHNVTLKKDLIESVRRLKFVGVRILGFVYNGYRRTGSGYYKNSKSYYKQYY